MTHRLFWPCNFAHALLIAPGISRPSDTDALSYGPSHNVLGLSNTSCSSHDGKFYKPVNHRSCLYKHFLRYMDGLFGTYHAFVYEDVISYVRLPPKVLDDLDYSTLLFRICDAIPCRLELVRSIAQRCIDVLGAYFRTCKRIHIPCYLSLARASNQFHLSESSRSIAVVMFGPYFQYYGICTHRLSATYGLSTGGGQ